MSDVIAKQSTEANNAQNIKNPTLGWMIGFLFVVSFLGLFSVVPLRKVRNLYIWVTVGMLKMAVEGFFL
jgi:hypothetical protein